MLPGTSTICRSSAWTKEAAESTDTQVTPLSSISFTSRACSQALRFENAQPPFTFLFLGANHLPTR